MKRLGWVIALSALLALQGSPVFAAAATGSDYALQNGWFYTQANGQGGGPGQPGYAVTNANGINFYDVFKAGGVGEYGYPASPRLQFQAFTIQVFQKSVLQAAGSAVNHLNAMDILHDSGRDAWLEATYQTPPPENTSPDSGLSFDQVKARHQAFLDSDPALKQAYFSASHPLALYGLPMTHPVSELNGQVVVVRLQRAVLQHWLVTVPWAKANQVTVANGGDIFKVSGLIPSGLFAPEPPLVPGSIYAETAGAASSFPLSQVMLTSADLPGFTKSVRGSYSTGADVSDEWLLSSGRAPVNGPVAVSDEVADLADPVIAQAFVQFLAASTIPSGLAGAGFSSLQIQTLNAPPGLGQAAAAFQVNASPPAVTVFIIYFAMNNYVVHVEVGGAQGKVTEDSALTYARLIASRFPPQ